MDEGPLSTHRGGEPATLTAAVRGRSRPTALSLCAQGQVVEDTSSPAGHAGAHR